MNLKELKKELPYSWRVQSYSKYKAEAQCVAYITARDVMELLDEVCGAEGWQDAYRVEGNMLFAGIGIKVGEEWVWKWDTGSESNIEKEKGHASDAFKRAGVKHGIGRFLYSLKIHKVDANEKKAQGNYPYPVDSNGKRIYDLTKHINSLKGNTPKERDVLGFQALLDKFNGAKNKFELENIKKKYKLDLDNCSSQEKEDLRAEYKLILKGHVEGAMK